MFRELPCEILVELFKFSDRQFIQRSLTVVNRRFCRIISQCLGSGPPYFVLDRIQIDWRWEKSIFMKVLPDSTPFIHCSFAEFAEKWARKVPEYLRVKYTHFVDNAKEPHISNRMDIAIVLRTMMRMWKNFASFVSIDNIYSSTDLADFLVLADVPFLELKMNWWQGFGCLLKISGIHDCVVILLMYDLYFEISYRRDIDGETSAIVDWLHSPPHPRFAYCSRVMNRRYMKINGNCNAKPWRGPLSAEWLRDALKEALKQRFLTSSEKCTFEFVLGTWPWDGPPATDQLENKSTGETLSLATSTSLSVHRGESTIDKMFPYC